MSGSAIATRQRFSGKHPCPVCGGHAGLPQGRGVRCYGFVSEDGVWAHCTRDERAGPLEPHPGSLTYAHRLDGDCRCGQAHGGGPRPPAPARPSDADHAERSALALELWERSRRAEGTQVARYLTSRGLVGPIPSSIRFLAEHRHGPTGLVLPVMVAAVTRWPALMPVAVHRTFLKQDGSGKANVGPVKMMLGPVAGGAVRLAEPGTTLLVAEGIETTLALQIATGQPAWAALSASNLPAVQLPPPPLAAEVVIGADPDPTGLRAAQAAAERWRAEGRTVRIAVPPAGADFNDLLVRGVA